MFKKVLVILLLSCLSFVSFATDSNKPILHKGMKILIIGSGGREHAMAWKVSDSPWVEKVFVAPGNAGTATEPKVENVNIAATSLNELLDFAITNNIDLTIVGPETPLAQGIVDKFAASHQPCFGPTQAAAQLESSKIFSKDFMARHNIPTAKYATFSDYAAAEKYVLRNGTPIVIKADGLAGGKGVVVAHTLNEALSFLKQLMHEGNLSNAGKKVVIEEFLQGEELSFIVITDGKNFIPLATSQDHKQLYNQDQGPNTGGMGAYSPVNIIANNEEILKNIVEPTIRGMARENMPYTGVLYVGLMMTPNGPKVLEYNCRLGDPEAQVLLMRLKSDLVEMCAATLEKRLDKLALQWDQRSAITVVIASNTYPSSSSEKTTLALNNFTPSKDSKIFHANTERNGDNIRAKSGRILTITALGNTLHDARATAYSIINNSKWDKIQYRNDIGYRELARETKTAALAKK